MLRRITAEQDGCGYRQECADRDAVVGLGDYRGDQTHLRETYGSWPPPGRRPAEPDLTMRAFENFTQDWREQHPYDAPLEPPSPEE